MLFCNGGVSQLGYTWDVYPSKAETTDSDIVKLLAGELQYAMKNQKIWMVYGYEFCFKATVVTTARFINLKFDTGSAPRKIWGVDSKNYRKTFEL